MSTLNFRSGWKARFRLCLALVNGEKDLSNQRWAHRVGAFLKAVGDALLSVGTAALHHADQSRYHLQHSRQRLQRNNNAPLIYLAKSKSGLFSDSQAAKRGPSLGHVPSWVARFVSARTMY